MSPIGELLSTWDAKEAARQTAQDYCAFALGATGNLPELFVDETYRRYLGALRGAHGARQAQVIHRFLMYVQAQRPELVSLTLPSLDRAPRPQRSALVERFLRAGDRDLIRVELYQALEDVIALTGLPAASVAPKDFCRLEVVEALARRIAHWSARRGQGRDLAHRFLREQAEAARVPAEAQRQILLPLMPPQVPYEKVPLSPWIAEYQVHYTANGHGAPHAALPALRNFEHFITRTFPHLLDDGGCLDLRRLRAEHVLASGLKLSLSCTKVTSSSAVSMLGS